jgi:ferrous iron transport protein B
MRPIPANPGSDSESPAPSACRRADHAATVAVAGNPNSGKSTLFNALTGLRQKVANYPGVTVEKKMGRVYGSHGEKLDLLDLPGIYSLQARSPDEELTRDVLLGRRSDTPAPDVILCVVDAANLERNLYLVAQLAELEIPMVVALVMIDLAERDGWAILVPELSRRLGCPVVPTVAAEGRGLVELRQAITRQLGGTAPQRATLPPAIERGVCQVKQALDRESPRAPGSTLGEAILLVTGTSEQAAAASETVKPVLAQVRNDLANAGVDPLAVTVQTRYAWVETLVEHAVRTRRGPGATLSERLDGIFTHKIWGWIFFAGVMGLVFFTVFRVAELPMGWIESAQGICTGWIEGWLPEGEFRDLLTQGVIAGVGGVLIFLPQIMILFFFIGLIEDTGYMARAAFIVDRLMSCVGLHGKSFVPMLSSFACAIPGIMGARVIDHPKDRLVTILVAPLVSCSARLPVYSLMIALMLPPGFGAWRKAGLMLGLYAFGLGAALGMAWLFRRTLLKGQRTHLLLELPPYRRPSLRVTLSRMWERSGLFLRQAGTVILALSILVWALSSYPKPAEPGATPAEALAESVAGRMGRMLEPVIAPLGYDWKIGIGIISSFAAREVFVGTMSIIYSIENGEEETTALRDAMMREKRADGSPTYTPLVCLSLMVFYVLAMQCLSTLAVVRRETRSWGWPLFQFAYMTLLAWLAAFLVFQGGRLLGFS